MIEVLLAEDEPMLRRALAALLNLEPDIKVVAELADGSEIWGEAVRMQPDVAILDVDLPGLDGLSAASELITHLPGIAVMILTSLNRPGTLRRAMTTRVHGFMLKDASPQDLIDGVRSVVAGERVIDKSLALSAWESPDCPLTRRELEVLRLSSEGAEAKEIAKRLHLSAGTVRNYLTSSQTKLNARNRVDALRIARDTGWL